MASLAEWFEKQERYRPKWEHGARVFGHWNEIPFIGMLVADREKDQILVQPDLPIKFDGKLNNVLIVKHKDIKRLKSMDDEEPLKLPVAGSIPVKRTKTKNK